MFGLGTKKSYEELIRKVLENNDIEGAVRIAREAFGVKNIEEGTLAWISAVLFERGVGSAADLLEQFVERHPGSLHLPRVYLADMCARTGRYDAATDHARVYLRQCKDAGVFPVLGDRRVLREGVSKAFLLMTAAYTELGSRSYSERVLRAALQLAISEDWASTINAELNRLAIEKQSTENQAWDHQWESFFSNGQGSSELHELCLTNDCPMMAKRVDLIESNFRWNSTFKVGEAEMLMLVLVADSNKYLLK